MHKDQTSWMVMSQRPGLPGSSGSETDLNMSVIHDDITDTNILCPRQVKGVDMTVVTPGTDLTQWIQQYITVMTRHAV